MSKTKFGNLGFSSPATDKRIDNDFYATSEPTILKLYEALKFSKNIWEPCCGLGHISKIFELKKHVVKSTDLIYRGFGEKQELDFLKCKQKFNGDIVTNPPYIHAKEMILHSLKLIPTRKKVVMLLRLQFLEGQSRHTFFKNTPLRYVFVNSSRVLVYPNGDASKVQGQALAFAWYVWEKGYKGNPEIKWLP